MRAVTKCMQQHQSNALTMSYENANDNESVCSISSIHSTHSNRHENDDDECHGESAETCHMMHALIDL